MTTDDGRDAPPIGGSGIREDSGALPPAGGGSPCGESEASLASLADRLVAAAGETLAVAQSEEDLRIGFEKALAPVFEALGIKTRPAYEKSIIEVGRMDAVHGQVVIEYEAPRAFRSPAAVDHAEEQLAAYLDGLAKETGDALFLFDPKVVGVGFDGEKIFFLQFRGDKRQAKTRLVSKDFVRLGPYDFDSQSARTLLTWMRALPRRLLTAEALAEVFGPDGPIARKAVSDLVDALTHWAETPRVRTFYEEWRRLFGIVYGEQFGKRLPGGVTDFAQRYGVRSDIDLQPLLFAIHTYFVLLMKLIAAELLTAPSQPLQSSFCDDLAHARSEDLRRRLADIEDGGVYARKGVTNFLEGDFFRWYLDALSPALEDAVRDIARALSEFEADTRVIAPLAQRDLLKKLYQFLVPPEIRRALGEYYTPDWLAEMTLDEVKYAGDTRKRLLDPACGSGTFLVLAISRAREFARRRREPALSAAKRILANIWGFDLNPLAVLSARMNYLFALGDLRETLGEFEVPVYLADSVLWPGRMKQKRISFAGEECVLVPTSAGMFHVPAIWVEQRGFLMRRAAPILEDIVKAGYPPEDALACLRAKGLVFPPHEKAVAHFYQELLDLDRESRNGIWARFLKNAFAPMIAARFDFVVGNPPWIRWGYLSDEYREATLPLWQQYGLFSLKGAAARLGAGEKDFSMLFTYAAVDFYLAEKGVLGFLITQEVFKSKGAGEGFRRFRLREEKPLRPFKVLKAHDLATVQPFEGAANKTAMIVLRNSQTTRYPISYTVWTRKPGAGRIPGDIPRAKARPCLQRRRLKARPIRGETGSWQTIDAAGQRLAALQGTNAYTARRGASTEPYGVYWLRVEEVLSDGKLLVSNRPERGKRAIPPVRHVKVESDLVFPAVTGGDIRRWRAEPGTYLLMVQDPATCRPYDETTMRRRWPHTYSYLLPFKDALLSRGSKTVRKFAERTAFYAMFGIGPYTVARYRVAWKRMASDLVAAVLSQHKTPFGHKTLIATDTTSLFAVEREDEAHYLCGILNSTPVREFVRSYSSAGRGFGAPAVMQHLAIPLFDARNKRHAAIAEIARACRDAAEAAPKAPARLEEQLDDAVGRLFGL